MKLILYLVAFLEGFCTLAVELLAMRILIPVVGSSVILTGAVLSVILLSLSLGFEYAGHLARGNRRQKALVNNLSLSATLYAWGLFVLPRLADALVGEIGLSWGLLLAIAVALALPVFLASCTLPILVQMHSEPQPNQPGHAVGRMLLLSTLGSVLGGLLPPLFFGWIGVQWMAVGVVWLLWLSAFVLARGEAGAMPYPWLILLGLPALGLLLVHSPSLYRVDSAYQRLEVVQVGDERRMYTNGQAASGLLWTSHQPSFSYISEALEVLRNVSSEIHLA